MQKSTVEINYKLKLSFVLSKKEILKIKPVMNKCFHPQFQGYPQSIKLTLFSLAYCSLNFVKSTLCFRFQKMQIKISLSFALKIVHFLGVE